LINVSGCFLGKQIAQLNILVIVFGDCATLNASFEVQLHRYKTRSDGGLAGERELIFLTLEKE